MRETNRRMRKSHYRRFLTNGKKVRSAFLISFFVITAVISLPFSFRDNSPSSTMANIEGASAWSAENPAYKEYVEKAEDLLFAERYKEVVELLEEAISERGHNTGLLHFYLALSYDNLEELEPAVTNYKKAISLNIDKEKLKVSLRNLGIILRNQERHKEAAGYFNRYLKLVPDDPDADNIRSYVNYYSKQLK